MDRIEYIDKFHNDYNKAFRSAIFAINEGRNIILCGYEGSGKSHMRDELTTSLDHHNYKCYIDMKAYLYDINFNGKTYMNKVFIEVCNMDEIGSLLIDYEFIELHHRHPSIINRYKIKTPSSYEPQYDSQYDSQYDHNITPYHHSIKIHDVR